jgi:hypothetical protein
MLETSIATNPQIAGTRYRILRYGWNRVRRIVVRSSQQFIDLSDIEPGHAEIKVLLFELQQFQGKHFVIPSGIERKFVVRDDVCALLRLGQVIQNDDRRLFELQLARCKKAAVSGDNACLTIDQNRVRESEFSDARGNLRNLRVRVCPRVPRVGNEAIEWPVLDVFWGRDAGHPLLNSNRRFHSSTDNCIKFGW